nr:hypothetical protein [Tanacetum cinerariifolium]
MLFKTLSLHESRSPVSDLFFDLEENSEEEVTETMAETMKEYMSKTRADYGSCVTRPKIDDKDHFKLKGQFLKELRDNTFSILDHEDANEHIENGLEVPTRQILDSKGAIPTKTAADVKDVRNVKDPTTPKSVHLKKNETLKEAYYTQFGVPFQQRGKYKAAALEFYQGNNANPSYQERRQSLEESLSKFMKQRDMKKTPI